MPPILTVSGQTMLNTPSVHVGFGYRKTTGPARIQNAIEALEKLLQGYPDTPLAADAHYWLGDCYLQLGDDNRAAIHYQKVTNDYFDQLISEQSQFKLARIYEDQNNLAVAISMYQSLVEISNNPTTVAQARKRIRSLRLGRVPSDLSALEPEAVDSLGLNMPSERRSLGPPTEKLPVKSVTTAVPHPDTDDEKIRTESKSVPQEAPPDDIEASDIPSDDIQSETTAPTSKKRIPQPWKNERRVPVQNAPGEKLASQPRCQPHVAAPTWT